MCPFQTRVMGSACVVVLTLLRSTLQNPLCLIRSFVSIREESLCRVYKGTSLIRKRAPPRTTLGPYSAVGKWGGVNGSGSLLGERKW